SLEHSAWAATGAINRTSMQPNRIMRASWSAATDAIDLPRFADYRALRTAEDCSAEHRAGDRRRSYAKADPDSVPLITDATDHRSASMAPRKRGPGEPLLRLPTPAFAGVTNANV